MLINTTPLGNLERFRYWCQKILPAVYDDSLSYYELLNKVVAKLNEVIEQSNEQTDAIRELQDLFTQLHDYVEHYFDNLDVQEEINHKLDVMVEDGTLNNILTNATFTAEFDMRYYARKVYKNRNATLASPSSTPLADSMQGGCVVDANHIAYMLWDSTNYDYNKLVILNFNTGEVINTVDFNIGWCNSMCYDGTNFYVGVRGNSSGDSNNVVVISGDTYEIISTVNMGYKVNSISYYDGNFYVLDEATKILHVCDEELTDTGAQIALGSIIAGAYTQTANVIDNYIYIVTNSFNAITVVGLDGVPVRRYDIPKTGSHLAVGEAQYVIKINGKFYLGSDLYVPGTSLARWFEVDFKKNIIGRGEEGTSSVTLYANSTVDDFFADGTSSHPFKEVIEATDTDYPAIVFNGNNKEYDYCVFFCSRVIKFNNFKFVNGIRIRYAQRVSFTDCEFTAGGVKIDNSLCALSVGDSTVTTSSCKFSDGDYGIMAERSSTIHHRNSTFTGQAISAIKVLTTDSYVSSHNTDKPWQGFVNFNTYDMLNSWTRKWEAGTYSWSSMGNTLPEKEIKLLMNNCPRMSIIYQLGNRTGNKIMEFARSFGETTSVDIMDVISSSSSYAPRIVICPLTITPTGITIAQQKVNSISGGTFVDVTSADSAIQIRDIVFHGTL